MIGNLTRLRSLDLSYNKLEDLSSDNETFRLSQNITEIYLSHNFLSTLPLGHLINTTHVNVLDIRFNQFDNFPNALTKMVYNNTKVHFEGE